jgi:hypothetical protein
MALLTLLGGMTRLLAVTAGKLIRTGVRACILDQLGIQREE